MFTIPITVIVTKAAADTRYTITMMDRESVREEFYVHKLVLAKHTLTGAVGTVPPFLMLKVNTNVLNQGIVTRTSGTDVTHSERDISIPLFGAVNQGDVGTVIFDGPSVPIRRMTFSLLTFNATADEFQKYTDFTTGVFHFQAYLKRQ